MRNKNIIVTGATGAIGKALVEAAISEGAATVVMACRDIKRARQIADTLFTGETHLIPMTLDLARFDSIDDFVTRFADLNIPLDGIFNNAGVMPGTLSITADGNELATQVNCLSPIRLTRALVPLMRDGAFVVMTTSITRKVYSLHGSDPANWNKTHFSRFATYGRSKRMLTDETMRLADELAPRHIRVNCADPGIVNSRMINMNRWVDPIADIFFRPFIRSPRKGSLPLLRAAKSTLTARVFTLRKTHKR